MSQPTAVNDTWGSSTTENSSDDDKRHSQTKTQSNHDKQKPSSTNNKLTTSTSAPSKSFAGVTPAPTRQAVSLDFDYGATTNFSLIDANSDEEDVDEGGSLFGSGSDVDALLNGLENIESRKAI